MKARINSKSIRRAKAEQAGREMADKLLIEQTNREAKRYDMILAYVLHNEFGFGRARIMRFLRGIVDAHIYTCDRYGARYSDSAYNQALLRDRLNIDEMEDELDDYTRSQEVEI